MDQERDDAPATKQPVDVIRDSNLKASIWRNEADKGPFFATTFARTYKDEDGQYRDTHSFVGSDLLKLSELARAAYTRTNELRREERQIRTDNARDEPDTARRAEFKQQRSATAGREKSRDQQR
ncbi:hypothetical protein BAL199_21359 [alpha proteobacterium BAL199]|nr:hypothetical protein BAL199_21359 [alpha proteobacterium BAL199]